MRPTSLSFRREIRRQYIWPFFHPDFSGHGQHPPYRKSRRTVRHAGRAFRPHLPEPRRPHDKGQHEEYNRIQETGWKSDNEVYEGKPLALRTRFEDGSLPSLLKFFPRSQTDRRDRIPKVILCFSICRTISTSGSWPEYHLLCAECGQNRMDSKRIRLTQASSASFPAGTHPEESVRPPRREAARVLLLGANEEDEGSDPDSGPRHGTPTHPSRQLIRRRQDRTSSP